MHYCKECKIYCNTMALWWSVDGHDGRSVLQVTWLCAVQLAPDLGRNLRMRLTLQQLQQRLLLFGGQVGFVALHQRQQALVPQHRQRPFVRAERQKVRDQSVQHAEGQRVLLIQQQPQENAVGSVVLHLCDFQHGSAATYNGGLAARKNYKYVNKVVLLWDWSRNNLRIFSQKSKNINFTLKMLPCNLTMLWLYSCNCNYIPKIYKFNLV